jgi:hypothetical protein
MAKRTSSRLRRYAEGGEVDAAASAFGKAADQATAAIGGKNFNTSLQRQEIAGDRMVRSLGAKGLYPKNQPEGYPEPSGQTFGKRKGGKVTRVAKPKQKTKR